MDLGLTTDPNMHRAQKRPFKSADRSRAIVGGSGQDFWKAETRIKLCSVGVQTRNTLESKSGVEMGKTTPLDTQTEPLHQGTKLN